MDNTNIVKIIKNDVISDKVSISKKFIDDFFTEKNIDIPINALRIIINIISAIKSEQFIPKNQPKQLTLFEENFKTVNNSFVSLTIKNSNIEKSKNKNQIKEAFEFLVHYKEGWYKSKNYLGKTIESYGGLITSPSYERGKTSFLINSYWYENLLKLEPFNDVLYQIVYKINNNKHILFLFWLISLHETGTRIKFSTLQNKFGYNFKTNYEFERSFLHKVKLNLDKHSNISFNYQYKNDLYSIVKYLTTESSIKKEYHYSITEKTYDKIKINRLLKYYKERHNISEINLILLKSCLKNDTELIVESYKSLKHSIHEEGKKMTDLIDIVFLKKLQEQIVLNYSNSKKGKFYPEAYPKVIA